MHSEYLERLFLKNEFAKGRFTLENHSIVAENIYLPAFIVSTEKDHVAPWHSVYKLHLMLNSAITFVLTNGGHNAGIISEPGHEERYYHIHQRKQEAPYLNPAKWLEKAEKREGSWWFAWHQWLTQLSSADLVSPPKLDENLPDAPGTYVLQK